MNNKREHIEEMYYAVLPAEKAGARCPQRNTS